MSKRKAPIWVRVKASKQRVKDLLKIISQKDRDLQTARSLAKHYEESFQFAINSLNKCNDNVTKLLCVMVDWLNNPKK